MNFFIFDPLWGKYECQSETGFQFHRLMLNIVVCNECANLFIRTIRHFHGRICPLESADKLLTIVSNLGFFPMIHWENVWLHINRRMVNTSSYKNVCFVIEEPVAEFSLTVNQMENCKHHQIPFHLTRYENHFS